MTYGQALPASAPHWHALPACEGPRTCWRSGPWCGDCHPAMPQCGTTSAQLLRPCPAAVWYHVVSGRKVFLAAPPTPENLQAFEEWSSSGKQARVARGCLWRLHALPAQIPAAASVICQRPVRLLIHLPASCKHGAPPAHPTLSPAILAFLLPLGGGRPRKACFSAAFRALLSLSSAPPPRAQASSWLGDKLSGLVRLSVGAGDTLLLPSAWPHAVSTPEPSFAVGAPPGLYGGPPVTARHSCPCSPISASPGSPCSAPARNPRAGRHGFTATLG